MEYKLICDDNELVAFYRRNPIPNNQFNWKAQPPQINLNVPYWLTTCKSMHQWELGRMHFWPIFLLKLYRADHGSLGQTNLLQNIRASQQRRLLRCKGISQHIILRDPRYIAITRQTTGAYKTLSFACLLSIISKFQIKTNALPQNLKPQLEWNMIWINDEPQAAEISK